MECESSHTRSVNECERSPLSRGRRAEVDTDVDLGGLEVVITIHSKLRKVIVPKKISTL